MIGKNVLRHKSADTSINGGKRKNVRIEKKVCDLRVDKSCPLAKRAVTINTVNKWIAENDKKLGTTAWLCYDKVNRDHVSTLRCSICIRFQDKL